MRYTVILRILGLLVMLFSLTILPPLLVSLFYQDGEVNTFLFAFVSIFISGFLIWLPFYQSRKELRTRDGFVITVLFWTVLSLFGTLPFVIANQPHLDLTNAFFESMSALTTTGATVITHIDDLPQSILFYRQQLQWLGGMGIIVLAVAILPMLGVGGMQLYRAEIPGPLKDSKLTPRITETAKALWFIYLALTVSCFLAYWLAGMSLFDAICHSFTTVSIGGLSTHDQSLGYFQNPGIEMVAIIFMLISGVNFALHFFAWRRKTLLHYFADPESRAFFGSLFIIAVITCGYLIYSGTYDTLDAFRNGVFQVVSISTTTGYSNASFSIWPAFLPILLVLSAFVGGCAGSTGGGLKVIRALLIYKQGVREIKRLIHPNATIPIKLGKKPLSELVIEAVWGFFSVYIIIFVFFLMAMMATGLDFLTAFSAVAACINNLGPGLGDVSSHYADISDTAKWLLCLAMLLGRLEIYTLLVLFTPMFWRR